MKTKANSILKGFLKISVAFLILFWMDQKGLLEFSILNKLMNPYYFFLCSGLILILLIVNNIRWMILMRGQGLNAPFFMTLELTFISLFFSFIIPGGVGGDVVKGYYILKDYPQKKMVAATSILVDRVVGVFGLVLISLLAILFNLNFILKNSQLWPLVFMVLAAVLFFVAFFAFTYSRRIYNHRLVQSILNWIPGSELIKKVYQAFQDYSRKIKTLVYSILLCFISQGASISMMYFAGQAMGFDKVPFSVYFFVAPIGLITTAIPISPAGIGVGQAAFLVLFNLVIGASSQLGPSVITASQVFSLMWGLLGGVFYILKKKADPSMDQKLRLES